MSYDKCPFCEMGQAKRMMIWRLMNDLSRSSIKELAKKKEGLEPMKLINETGKKLLLHFATGPCTDKKILLEAPEGEGYLDPKKVAGAIYIHKEDKNG